ncbi:hypothetical protein M427DRAFT_61202 [Gonapodya prolifera JEL478]|uniref:Uncharacterized protein n=1 Tax=Gonapodya prolifera (strain JEL478) TaxID=1344416 RepID=A0A139A2V8_GONPJ|nr:hypothetical protein M427DRAFT_61202 [Gonapodya prolifera JEL478]|eukprot:KXS11120.1 hypothetical protein M427DRAFT_61202 [Gonapodya prolifera JEL478]
MKSWFWEASDVISRSSIWSSTTGSEPPIGEQQWHAMRTFAASDYGNVLKTVELEHLSTWLPPEGSDSLDFRVWNGVTEVGVEESTGRMPIGAGSEHL